MKPAIKFGLIVGGVGLFLTACVGFILGICGPVVALIAGGVAGFLTAREVRPYTKGDGAKEGGIAGGVAGALTTVGQLIGGFSSILLAQVAGFSSPFGQIPTFDGPTAELVGYYIGGLLSGGCIGLVGLLLAAGAGALAGYLATEQTSV